MILKTPPGSSQTAYQLAGPDDADPVVLIHGLGLCRKIWQPFIDSLSATYRVIAYDLYGHGESDPAPEPPSLSLFARQIDELMTHLNIPAAHIIGFSIGGMINRRLAMDFPKRCKSLVILNSPHDRGESGQEAVEDRASKVQQEGKMATLPAALERWFTPAFRSAHPQSLADVKDWRQRTDDASYAGAAWVLAHGVRELTAPELTFSLPGCVITTANDSGSTPAMAAMISQQIPGAELHIIPELQHLGLMEDPQVFIEFITSFLSSASRKDLS